MRVLAVIPARGGSKSIRRKNIHTLAGKPLIAYTIQSAKQSKRITSFVTSTEDAEIGRVAAEWGSPVLPRPPELARDETPMPPVLLHALDAKAREGEQFDVILLLQPTCPLRTGVDIDRALAVLEAVNADAVISVYRVYDEHPGRMYSIRDGRMAPLAPQWEMMNRQDLPAVYHRNGMIYAARVPMFQEKKTFYVHNVVPYVMEKERSVNIDDNFDLRIAELLLGGSGLAHS